MLKSCSPCPGGSQHPVLLCHVQSSTHRSCSSCPSQRCHGPAEGCLDFFFFSFFVRGHHGDSKASAWRPDAGHLAWRNEVKGDAQPPQPGPAPAQGCCACPEPLSCKLSSSCLHMQQNGFIYVAFQAGSTAGRGTRDRGSERSCPKI